MLRHLQRTSQPLVTFARRFRVSSAPVTWLIQSQRLSSSSAATSGSTQAATTNTTLSNKPPLKPTVFELIAQAQLKRPSFEFAFAAAGSAKPLDIDHDAARDRKSDTHFTSSLSNPSTDSLLKPDGFSVRVGEDAYFIRKDGLGVADGVGGWKDVVKGSNAALFSSRLMHHVAAQLDYFDDVANNDYDINDYYALDPVKVLQVACERTLEDAGAKDSEKKAVGSTTALIAFLRDDELRIATLGDTSCLVFRNGALIFRTEEQQHSFNFPYQLGSDSKDTPEKDALTYRVKVQEGDLIVVGSDGIFDNLFDEDILDLINSTILGTPSATASNTTHTHSPISSTIPPARILRTDPHKIASAILERARQVSLDSGADVSSPFQERAVREGLYYQGGKMDDLTVVVGVVKGSEDSPDRR